MSIYEQYNVWLTSLDDLKRFIASSSTDTYDSDDDLQLKDFIQQASQEIVDTLLQRLPLPYHATHLFDYNRYHVRGRRLASDYDLLSITTLTNGDADVIASSDYVLRPANEFPKSEVILTISSNLYWTYTTDPEQAISIQGIWGYVPNWDSAWSDTTKAIPAGGITDSATSWTFAPIADADSFSAGDYLRLESEYVLVTASDGSTGVVTIERAVLGTTAAAHAAAVTIERYIMNSTIKRAATEYSAYLYKTKDNLGSQVEFHDGVTSVNNGLSKRLLAALRSKRKLIFRMA